MFLKTVTIKSMVFWEYRKIKLFGLFLIMHWTDLHLDQYRPSAEIDTLTHPISHSDVANYRMPIVQ